MGLRGEAAIVGFVELPPERLNKASPAPFVLEQWAELSAVALDDAGLPGDVVNGIVASHLAESEIFVPSTIAEYLGVDARFAEHVDLGGASAAAMVWRAAAAIELGICDAVLCALPARYITPSSKKKPRSMVDAMFFGSSSNQFGSPQAEFEIPYGNLGQNGPYGQVAQRYAAVYGYDERAMAKLVVDTRVNANHTDGAIWKDKPLTVDDVLASPVIADPLHMLEIVMPCVGGAAFVVANHDLTFRGDFPLNTAGGQLGFGQAGLAGGMHHVCDATRQIMGRAGAAQVADCNRAFVSGNGGILSEQTTLILQGD